MHPASARFKVECSILAEEVATLLAHLDHRLRLSRPFLESKYMTEIGVYEMDLFALECDNRRVRREIELIQAALNRGELPSGRVIQETLDRELREWETKLEALRLQLKASRNYMSGDHIENIRPDIEGHLSKARAPVAP